LQRSGTASPSDNPPFWKNDSSRYVALGEHYRKIV